MLNSIKTFLEKHSQSALVVFWVVNVGYISIAILQILMRSLTIGSSSSTPHGMIANVSFSLMIGWICLAILFLILYHFSGKNFLPTVFYEDVPTKCLAWGTSVFFFPPVILLMFIQILIKNIVSLSPRGKRIFIVLSIMFVFLLSNVITYNIASPPMGYGPSDPREYEYRNLFFNEKCMNTDDRFNDRDILEMLYYLGIPKKRAKELFGESKKNIEDVIANGTTWRCAQETLDYYNTAIKVLNDVDNVSNRKTREATERFRNERINQ